MKKLIPFIAIMVMILSACGGRDVSSVQTALHGQWESTEGSGERYYISDTMITQVYEGENGEEVQHTFAYEVMEYDESTNRLKIKLTNEEEGIGFISEVIFDDDTREDFGIRKLERVNMRSKLLAGANGNMRNNRPTYTFTYVDSKQSPAGR